MPPIEAFIFAERWQHQIIPRTDGALQRRVSQMLSFYSDVLNLAGRDIFWSAIARNNKLVALSLDRSSEEALAYFETLGLEPDRVTKSPFKAWISEL